MTDVYLIRHSLKMRAPVGGKTTAFDLMQPLSVEGEERAKKLLDIQELRGADFAAASNMSRSLATLRYLIEADSVPYIMDDRLREMPPWPMPKPEPGKPGALPKWPEPDYKPEGGESILECRARMEEAILEAVRDHPGQKILIGSHGRSIGAYLSGFLEAFDDDFVPNINFPDVFHLTFDGETVTAYQRIKMPFPPPERPPFPG